MAASQRVVLRARGRRHPSLGRRGQTLTAFMAEKQLPLAVNLVDDGEPASLKTVRAKEARYRLLSFAAVPGRCAAANPGAASALDLPMRPGGGA